MRHISKWITVLVLLGIVSAALLGTVVCAQEYETANVIIDGQTIEFDVPPIIIDDRTLVPFRKIFEFYAFNVSWVESTNTVIANKPGQSIVLQIGNKRAFVNSQPKDLDVPAQLVNDRTLVPLRFVAENIGADVEWVGQTSTVVITSKQAN